MKKLLKKFVSTCLLLVLVLSLTACSSKPDPNIAAKGFLDAVKQLDFDKAATFMKNDGSVEAFKYDDADQEKIIKAIFSKIEYQLDEPVIKDANGTVKAKITAVDLSKVTEKMISDLLPKMMAQALSGEEIDEKKQQDMMMEYLVNSISDSSVAKAVTDIEIKLVKDKKAWLVEPSDDLLNALTGNFEKAFQGLGN